ncbi:MAG: FKBP-type peptidyl-prolyl cis-trans isomerase [Chlorobiota bacterium]
MKLMNLFVIGTILFGIACTDMQGQVELKTEQDSLAYAIGMQWGKNLMVDDLKLNSDVIKAGLEDAYKEAPKLTDAEMQAILTNLQQKLQDKRMKEQQQASSKNLETANQFLEKNKTAEGVKTTASGLQYKVLKEGNGVSPKATDNVKVHYHGTLIDGKVFDSSVERGQPAEFPLNRVIPGWTEGLQLMKKGAKYRFFIPPGLAYGAQGAGSIGPNSLLIFDVELIDVNPAKQ